MTERAHVARALMAELSGTLTPECIVDCAHGDADERTAAHVSGTDVGRPLTWIRPRHTDDVAQVVRIARGLGVRVVPIGRATTFWGGTNVRDAVALDTTTLTSPFVLDGEARVAHLGAGCDFRTVERAARRLGLCVAARPDTGGDTPVGSMLAVGSAAGLGMGHGLPLEQVSGAVAVTGTGRTIRLGAGALLHGRPHGEHGLPHALSLLAGAEGRGCIVTEVGLRLRRAPHLVTLRAARGGTAVGAEAHVDELLRMARIELDLRALDTFRLELSAPGRREGARFEVMLRAFSDDSSDAALVTARRWQPRLAACGFDVESPEVEPASAHDGTDDAYHGSFGHDRHRASLLGAAFWGAEVTTTWGESTRSATATALGLFDALAAIDPVHRRFAVYPGHHVVSVGVHVLVPRDPDSIERAVALLRTAAPALTDVGVPYRSRGLFAPSLAARLAVGDARATSETVDAMFSVLDPDDVLGSADGRTDPS